MKTQKNSFGICLGLTISTCILPVTSVAQFPPKRRIISHPANLGVQVLRRTDGKITELTKLDTFSDF